MSQSVFQLGPAFLISLASKRDRRAFCGKQFRAERLDVKFFDAIVPPDKANFPTRGTLGCYLSHLQVIDDALRAAPSTGATRVTIFEDDVLLPRGFAKIAEKVLGELEGLDWHICYWGMENRPPLSPLAGRASLRTIAPDDTIIGKQAYTVNLTSPHTPALVEYLRECREKRPGYSDGMFHQFRQINGLVAHTHILKQARQASFPSNLTPGAMNLPRKVMQYLKRQVQLATR